MTPSKRCASCRQLRKSLRELIESVTESIDVIDKEFKTGSPIGRGGRMAKVANGLELAKDIAKRFGLDAKEPKK